jgi:AcrR family transcriptional regulator
MKTAERRQNLKEALIAAATRSIEAHGLSSLKARELAAEAGCAVGAIYNVVADLDDLILAVNMRTLDALEARLTAANGREEGAIAQLIRLALAYLDFAATHTKRWRAVFEHHMPECRELPAEYLLQQRRLFAYIEQPLRILQPNLSPEASLLLARSLFSAVHGIVLLGLEERLGAISPADLETQIAAILTAFGRGLPARGNS